MKILHLTDGQPMIPLCRALRQQGVQATSCHFYSNAFSFKADICLNLQDYPKSERLQKMKEFLNSAIRQYDVFHFHFGFTFLPDKSDLAMLANANKKMIVHHQGSEVRRLSVARSFHNPYVRIKPYWTEEKILRDLQLLSTHIHHAIVPYHELFPYVQPFYKHVHFIPNSMEVSQVQPCYSPLKPSFPLIVHAPTNRDLKGTESILAAVKRLQDEGFRFNFQLIEQMPYEEAKRMYREADIVIDQLRIGDYGLVSIESMAMGKPVVCYIRDDLLPKYPDLPIVNANPDTITDVLRQLLANPSSWKTLGLKGRQYVELHHDVKKAADRLIRIYRML